MIETYNCNLSKEELDKLSKMDNLNDIIDYYYYAYPNKYYMNYPEFAVAKLRLEPELLSSLPELQIRTREDIKNWMQQYHISLDDFLYVGW